MCLYCVVSNQLIRELTHKCQAFENNLTGNSSPLLPPGRDAGDLGRGIRQVLHGYASVDFIVAKLHEHGYENMTYIGALQESDLTGMGLRKGHIAQLRDAVKAWSTSPIQRHRNTVVVSRPSSPVPSEPAPSETNFVEAPVSGERVLRTGEISYYG
ncbi:hypothetical protein K439DRAFT_677241 [Ramaria rubella]|nr:hypothetical protein K439DRAFT_677241 [Ramaria rubella]